MQVQLYKLKRKRPDEHERYTLDQALAGELVMRPWPWIEGGGKEFFSPTDVELAEMSDLPESPKSQAKAKQLPSKSQATASELPASSQPKASAVAAKSQHIGGQKPTALDYASDFDELEHYHQHLRVVELMKHPQVYAESKRCGSFDELATVVTFPRPAVKALNEALKWERSRDFYMNLYRIHTLVERQRPVWVVAAFERVVFGWMDSILYTNNKTR